MKRLERGEASRRVRAHLEAGARLRRRVAEETSGALLDSAEMVTAALRAGGKVMLCGNGGSAADAQHIAAEFTNRLRAGMERQALAALALTTDTSFLTSHANDVGFATVFRRQVEALGRRGDVLIVISTSGHSENLIRAVEACPARGIETVGFLGGDGGRLHSAVDLPLVVPSEDGQLVQETHIALGHLLCDLVEYTLFPEQRHSAQRRRHPGPRADSKPVREK
jgi:D-sedoheptulose 7-phosphate isomerase